MSFLGNQPLSSSSFTTVPALLPSVRKKEVVKLVVIMKVMVVVMEVVLEVMEVIFLVKMVGW